MLAHPDGSAWLAYQDDCVVSMLTFFPPQPGLATPPRSIYLDHGYTEPEARGTGVATMLLSHALAWAQSSGFDHCTVNFIAANLLSSRFWTSVGFRPLSYTLERHIDDRLSA